MSNLIAFLIGVCVFGLFLVAIAALSKINDTDAEQ